MSIDDHYCSRCGEEYDPFDQDAPEDASFHWVPKCPVCRADMTCTAVSSLWLEIVGDGITNRRDDPEEIERAIQSLHSQARFYHGRTTDLTVEELICRAKHLDEETSPKKIGPRPERDLAFNLRRQAREKVRAQ